MKEIKMQSQYEITKEYLEWVIQKYGENQQIMSTNCEGNPQQQGDYSYGYGTAKELLQRINNGEIITIV